MTGMSVFGRFDVRLDPWDVDYGSELAAHLLEDPQEEQVEVDVELPPERWRPLQPEREALPDPLLFVDGVRRVEARLLVWHAGKLCHGAFGSFGVGATQLSGARAAWRVRRVGRVAILGSGQRLPERVEVATGLVYEPASSDSPEVDGPMRALQEEMRQAEERLAHELAMDGRGLVITDGPLSFSEPLRGAVVGYVKRLFQL
jgi:hypothetical protein